ncbi:hypothetical protein R1sor_005087 [Riccia sorocarpa]|uniref:SMP-30/Gluconolactonase/LRE-like region domain-containing protein n=1 Tax=Riccia sorocarpa TaxID=122646 RepID=A0ABD3HMT4_9MARC
MGAARAVTLVCTLLLMHFLVAEAKIRVTTVKSTVFISAETSKFGLGIEGVAPDQNGVVYAVGFSGDGTSGIGTVANATGAVEQKLLLKDQTASLSFNGLRFLPLSPALSPYFELRGLAAEVKTHQVFYMLKSKRDGRTRGSVFCRNDSMIQPNDIAVAPKLGAIYMSGGAYGNVKTVVGQGDLWMCKAKDSFYQTSRDDLGPIPATRLGVLGLTNGIEVSPDEKFLYITESFHEFGEPKSNVIWRFDIDQNTGDVDVTKKTLLVDFQKLDGSGYVDLDGIRCDKDGNLFVTKNGRQGEVVKISPSGKLLLRIKLTGVFETTNLDFGGPDGKSLFISGKCVANPDLGCVDVWTEPKPALEVKECHELESRWEVSSLFL